MIFPNYIETLTSNKVLGLYLQSDPLCVGEIRFLAFNGVRDWHKDLPDYALKLPREIALPVDKTLSGLILGCLEGLADELLECEGRKPRIKKGRMEAWQKHTTSVSPTWLIVYATWKKWKNSSFKNEKDKQDQLLRTISFSTLPSPRNLLLEDIADNQGLFDLHIHLNGTTEADIFWQHAVKNPRDYSKVLNDMRTHSQDMKEFYASHGMECHHDILSRLQLANWLRRHIVEALFSELCPSSPGGGTCPLPGKPPTMSEVRDAFSGRLFLNDRSQLRDREKHHPLAEKWPYLKAASPIGAEGLMLFRCYEELHCRPNDCLCHMLHGYMLLQSSFCKLTVQQVNQIGFDQFQKITLTGLRDVHEDEQYEERFRQLQGMYGNGVRYVEGRFSPKDTPGKNRKLLKKITEGHKRAYGFYNQVSNPTGEFPCPDCPRTGRATARTHSHCPPDSEQRQKPFFQNVFEGIEPYMRATENMPQLGLVAHFIKKEDKKEGSFHHFELRKENEVRARALITAIEQDYDNSFASLFCGVDAASNELHTPPEVYAPTFRLMRDWGVRRVTYHVGEDFRHLLSGLRAVWEALAFLNMAEGDRIGHGTALGINPEIWKRSLGETIYVPQGEWLDNLVWLCHMTKNCRELPVSLSKLQAEIQRIFYDVYKKDCPDLFLLEQAWQMRELDPRAGLMDDTDGMKTFRWAESERLNKERKENSKAFELLKMYHDAHYRKNYGKVISVSHFADNELIRALQDAVVQEVNQRGVLVEVMPTSNWRISFYRSMKEHHCFLWLDENNPRPKPKFCIATDDPGIFSTNMKNEFCLVGEVLEAGGNNSDLRRIFNMLNANARSYRFPPAL